MALLYSWRGILCDHHDGAISKVAEVIGDDGHQSGLLDGSPHSKDPRGTGMSRACAKSKHVEGAGEGGGT